LWLLRGSRQMGSRLRFKKIEMLRLIAETKPEFVFLDE
jgi:hypothetical protein